MSTLKRRDFIKTAGAVVVGVSLLPSCATSSKDLTHYRFFNLDEANCVIALCEQIIPAGNGCGGATEAGVIFYIDRQLPGYFNEHATTYCDSLKKLQTHCNNKFGKLFHELSSTEQLGVMKEMEQNKIDPDTWKGSSGFFNLLIKHSMQGFYGSPIHGGNKDYMSFDMLRLEYPLNIGQNRYQNPLHNS